MSDFDSSLPIRTEDAGDVIVKLADATIPSQQLAVEADGSINVNISATDLDIRDLDAAQDNVAISDGTDTLEVNADGSLNITDNGASLTVDAVNLDIRDLVFATDKVDVSGSSVDVTATDLDIRDLSNAQDSIQSFQGGTWNVTVDNTVDATINDGGGSITVDAVDLDIRDLAFATDTVDVSGSSVTVSATDLDIRDLAAATDSVSAWLKDEAGNAFSGANPLPVSIVADIEGIEVNDYNTAAAVAAAGTSNHDYTTAGAFLLRQIEAASSGKMKIEVQVETAAASNVFNTRFVQFNSTAQTNMSITLASPIAVASGARVRVIRTNRDNQSQDLYSTISGQQV